MSNKLQDVLEDARNEAIKVVMQEWHDTYQTGLYSIVGTDRLVGEYFGISMRTVERMRYNEWNPFVINF